MRSAGEVQGDERGGGGALAYQEGVGPGIEPGQGQRGLAALENGAVKPACGAGDARPALVVQHLVLRGKGFQADSGGREGRKGRIYGWVDGCREGGS